MSSAFDKLERPVQKWVRARGWDELRDLQVRAIHALQDSEADVILSAATAGGKTEAAFLPLLSQVVDDPDPGAGVGGFDLVYIGPLKALINDQARRLEEICDLAELPVTPWHGDIATSVKKRAMAAPRGVLLITPESLEALFIRRGTQIARLFAATRAVVIDELHSVLDSERGVQLRSLLTRLELTLGRPIRRVGLSATLGDMALAAAYLRPDAPDRVTLINDSGGESELQLQLRGYLSGGRDDTSATAAVAAHLFKHLRGKDNLVFGGNRQSVEIYADRLRQLCDDARLPQEFHAHHASLSREHREFVEERLKDPGKPTTAICTSTLELGIDIGDVTCVAQVAAPFSVAALRQRMGRSGRRAGNPAILRQYAVETALTPESSPVDRLRLGLVRATAMIELLLEKWCEPPKPQALHLSTLVHQVLSVIAERGGASAQRLFVTLCQRGPFRAVDQALFAQVLRALGQPDIALIEQAADGMLLLGRQGERLVEHYSFYAVFKTPEEYRLLHAGKQLGTLPVDNILAPGMTLIFSGRRWSVDEVQEADKVIVVRPSTAGKPPVFGGDPGDLHDRVVARMFDLLEGEGTPIYLDPTANELLAEARREYRSLGLADRAMVPTGARDWILATRAGTMRSTTLALALGGAGYQVDNHDGLLVLRGTETAPPLPHLLSEIAAGAPVQLFQGEVTQPREKFHPFLTEQLLQQDMLSSRLDLPGLPALCRDILGRTH